MDRQFDKLWVIWCGKCGLGVFTDWGFVLVGCGGHGEKAPYHEISDSFYSLSVSSYKKCRQFDGKKYKERKKWSRSRRGRL
jgi:hypothetical protein